MSHPRGRPESELFSLAARGTALPIVASGAGEYGDNDDVTECPECGAEIYAIADRCPKCGHWFLQEDRRSMQSKRLSQSEVAERTMQIRIVKIASLILLIIMAICGIVALILLITGIGSYAQ